MSGVSLSRPQAAAAQTALDHSRRALRLLFGRSQGRAFRVRYWDGSTEGPGTDGVASTLVLNTPAALRLMLLPPSDLSLGEAYIFGDFDVEGNFEALLNEAVPMALRLLNPLLLARLVWTLLQLPAEGMPRRTRAADHEGGVHSRARDASAIRYHYDVGNDFYRLFLDERMVYSCAYFPEGDETLEQAQVNKLDRICRKLRLKPGEHLLDIGCGWGGMAIYAAQHYGARVTGITLSPSQAEVARERAAAAGVGQLVDIQIKDYRDMSGVQFDKISSIGMVEHVGRAKLPAYFAQAYRLLKPGGLFLNHGIVTANTPGFVHWGFGIIERYLNANSFIQQYVFPDGELRRVGETVTRAEAAGFETRDMESLREHYALTLREWVRRLERRHSEVLALSDEVTYRIWRLYMSGSAQSFHAGRIGITQLLLAKPTASGKANVPLSRADIEGAPPLEA